MQVVLDNYNAEIESREKTRAHIHPSDADDVDNPQVRAKVMERGGRREEEEEEEEKAANGRVGVDAGASGGVNAGAGTWHPKTPPEG